VVDLETVPPQTGGAAKAGAGRKTTVLPKKVARRRAAQRVLVDPLRIRAKRGVVWLLAVV